MHAAVSRFAIWIASHTFDPERNHALLRLLLAAFEAGDSAEGGSPLSLLQHVLSVSTRGSATIGGASFVASKFDAAAARLACPLGATLAELGAEGATTLWSAMLLRARVCVYHSGGVAPLLALVRCLPLLVWHRGRWEGALRGLCCASEEELAVLQAAGSLAAGFVDPAILERPQLYDVIVDAREGKGGGQSISVKLTPSGSSLCPPAAVAREVAKALEAVPPAASTQEVVEALSAKTSELLAKAEEVALQTGSDEAGLPEGVAAFLRRLHEAEGLGAGA